jgi:hypothetical protein
MSNFTSLFILFSVLALLCTLSITEAAIYLDDLSLSKTCDDAIGMTCGNGQCLNSSCVCDPLWSKKTDFVEFEDCATSYIGIWILWSINLLEIFWAYYKSLGVIILRIEVFLETRKTRKGYGLLQNKGLLAVLCYWCISTPFHFIMCIIHFIDPTVRIGFDVLPTLCFFFGKLGLYLAIFFVQGTMFALTLKGDSASRNLVRANYTFHFINSTFSIIIGTFGFIVLGAYQNDVNNQVAVMRAYYLSQSLTLICNGVGSLIIKRIVNKALDRVQNLSSGTRTNEIRAKINELQSAGMKQGLIQGVIYLMMGSIPFFINKHGYFLPISWLGRFENIRLIPTLTIATNTKTPHISYAYSWNQNRPSDCCR